MGILQQSESNQHYTEYRKLIKMPWGIGLQVKLGAGSQLALALFSGVGEHAYLKVSPTQLPLASSKAGLHLFSIILSLSDILSYRPKVPSQLLVEAEVIS